MGSLVFHDSRGLGNSPRSAEIFLCRSRPFLTIAASLGDGKPTHGRWISLRKFPRIVAGLQVSAFKRAMMRVDKCIKKSEISRNNRNTSSTARGGGGSFKDRQL